MASSSNNIPNSGAELGLIFKINTAQLSRYEEKTFRRQRIHLSLREQQIRQQLPASCIETKVQVKILVVEQPKTKDFENNFRKHDLCEVKRDVFLWGGVGFCFFVFQNDCCEIRSFSFFLGVC